MELNISQIRIVLEEAVVKGRRVESKVFDHDLPPPTKLYSDDDSVYETFRRLQMDSLPHVFAQIKNNHPRENIVALDIMGNGDVYRSLPKENRPDHIFAITLIDNRTEEEIVKDEVNGIHIIKGNVALPSTWRRLQKKLEDINISSIHYACARPLNGIYSIPNVDWLFWYIGERVYDLLNINEGIFLTEGPKNIPILEWVEYSKRSNLDIEALMLGGGEDKTNFLAARPILKIIRHQGSPKALPVMK